jgi:hypothetical protein
MKYYKQALAIGFELDDRYGIGNAPWGIAEAWKELGNPEQATKDAEAVLESYKEIGHPNAEEVRRRLKQWRRRKPG